MTQRRSLRDASAHLSWESSRDVGHGSGAGRQREMGQITVLQQQPLRLNEIKTVSTQADFTDGTNDRIHFEH